MDAVEYQPIVVRTKTFSARTVLRRNRNTVDILLQTPTLPSPIRKNTNGGGCDIKANWHQYRITYEKEMKQ